MIEISQPMRLADVVRNRACKPPHDQLVTDLLAVVVQKLNDAERRFLLDELRTARDDERVVITPETRRKVRDVLVQLGEGIN